MRGNALSGTQGGTYVFDECSFDDPQTTRRRSIESDAAAQETRKLKRAAKKALAFSQSQGVLETLDAKQISRWWSELKDETRPPGPSGTVKASVAAAFLLRTSLFDAVLVRIWDLVRTRFPHRRGRLSYQEFSAAVRLVGIAQIDANLLHSGSTVDAASAGRLSYKPRILPTAEEEEERARAAAAVWASPPGAPLPDTAAAERLAASPSPPSSSGIASPYTEAPLPTRRAYGDNQILLGIIAAHQPPPPSVASTGPESFSGPASRSPPSFSIPASVAASPPPAPSSGGPRFHLSECHRAKWVGERRTAAGARGIVSAVGGYGECSLMLSGPVLLAASFHSPPPSEQAAQPEVRLHWRHGAAAGAALAPLQDAFAPLPELLKRREEASKDAAFIAATNPECALLTATVPQPEQPGMHSPLPLLSWRVGEAAAPIFLRASLRRRPIVVPFKSAAELHLRLSSAAPSPLTSLRVVIHAGRVLGDSDATLTKASAWGCWDARRRVFSALLPQLQPHAKTCLRLQFEGDISSEAELGELEVGGASFALLDARCGGLSSLAGAMEEEQASGDASMQAIVFVDAECAARYEEARAECEPPSEAPADTA